MASAAGTPGRQAPDVVFALAAWPDEAEAPVCLMIDDLTDGWIDADGSGRPLGRNDWGAGLDLPGGSFHFLEQRILADFPEVRTTFFVPVARVEDVRPAARPSHFTPIDRRPEFAHFLRRLDADPRFECAYHGKEHGHPGPTAASYVAEFDAFGSLPEALSALRAGEQIWKSVFGRKPGGGKYPAYAKGTFGDIAVDLSGYAWWCRRWDRGVADAGAPAAFQPRFFGEHDVVDVPSTVHGGMLSLPPLSKITLRGLPGWGGVRLLGRGWLNDELDALLAQRGVVSVQEHITSSRPDGDVQTPNVYDDAKTLRHLFRRLRKRRVWHATCGEIAAYWRSRELTTLRARGHASFEVVRPRGEAPFAPLSLVLNGSVLPDVLPLRGPGGEFEARVSHRFGERTCVTSPLPLEAGLYELI